MNWRSHVLIGALLGFATFLIMGEGLLSLLILTVFAALSALAPDLDHESSKGRQLLDVVFVILACMTIYGSACGAKICLPDFKDAGSMVVTFLALAGAYFLFFRFLKPRHRGITHTFAACFAFAILLYFMTGKEMALAGLIGYASHLIADNELKLL